ncbi:MAG: sensor histidine kinase [Dehalococcoidia bacterium]
MNLNILKRDKPLTAVVALVLLAALLELFGVEGALPLAIMLAVAYAFIRLIATKLARTIARLKVSIRWKIVAALSLMALLFVFVSVINFEAMGYMHTELHAILDVRQRDPMRALAAVEDLEQTQHGFLFSFAPMLAVLGALVAVALGAAIAISVIEPLQRMKQAMRRIASGDFSQPVEVVNRDELGELAEHINNTAQDLARLQEATLAEERSRALRERIVQVTAAQEDERRRISRELHDGLGPSLAVIVNRLRSCQQLVRRDAGAAEVELEDMRRSLKGHIQDIRQLINGLRPLTVDQLGLVSATRQHVEQFASETGITALSLLSPVSLDSLAEVTLFRVLQECLSNVQRHAGAEQVEVQLRDTPEGVELIVRDNGSGFDQRVQGTRNAAGVGLVGMRERAELVRGRLHIRSSPGNGCEVRLTVPHRRSEVRTEASVGSYPSPAG